MTNLEQVDSSKKELNLSRLREALSDDFGLQINHLSSLDQKDLGDNSDVYFGEQDGQKVFIKIGDEAHLRHFNIEMAAQELFYENDIQSSRTIAFREKTKYIERPVAIQTAVEGTALRWLNSEKQSIIWEAAGKVLKQIHSIKLKGFGPLSLESGRLEGGLGSWKEYILANKPDLDYLAEQGFLSNAEMEKIEKVLLDISEVEVPQASFLHNDFHGAHIFTDGRGITGVIDLAGASAGDPRYDIATTHFFLSPENQAHFDRGYGDLALDPMVLKYHLLVAARKVEYRSRKGFKKRLPRAVEILKKSLNQGGSK